MAKYTNTELVNLVAESKEIDNEAKAQLIKMLRENKTYGLVWERNPEDAKEILKEKIPVFREVKAKQIISEYSDAPNHVLIEGDNLHVLNTLCFTHEAKFDLIYIDPPYNSGARDWRYNNDYVDANDTYRHSKWLSMIENRLLIAKRLLNPANSVLIVTIDEKEYHHLGCLLEDLFPFARIQMISSVINVKGVAREREFSRVNEYIYIVQIGDSKVEPLNLGEEWLGNIKSSGRNKVRLGSLLRSGSNSERSHSPGCFYPMYFTKDGQFIKAGDPIPLDVDRSTIPVPDDIIAVWPIHTNGSEGVWQYGKASFEKLLADGFVYFGKLKNGRVGISYAPKGVQAKIKEGLFKITGYDENGTAIIDDSNYVSTYIPGNQWAIPSHNATEYGSKLLKDMFGDKVFAYPKSLYAVEDTMRFFVAKKPNAMILDFFAGSGTTLHATMRLNQEDNGHRTCFLVTNNENNICEEVTYERNKKVIYGYAKPNGDKVEGLPNNNLRYFQTDLQDRSLNHQNKRTLFASLVDTIRIKENCYTELSHFGKLSLVGKEALLRFFEEDGQRLLIIFDSRVISHIVQEIKLMNTTAETIKVYVLADGSYPYTEDFKGVIDKVNLTAMPAAMIKALKYILPAQNDVQLDKVDLTDAEIEDEMNEAERIEEGKLL